MSKYNVNGPRKRDRSLSPDTSEKHPISDRKAVSIMNFRGHAYVNIREYYVDDQGESRPTKKGICLKPEEWFRIMDCKNYISDTLKAVVKAELAKEDEA